MSEGQGEGRPFGELMINGKIVRVKSRFPARENWDLPNLLMKFSQQEGGFDLKQIVPVLPRLVESWEFEGDPTDEDAYEELDLFRELIPLVREVSLALGQMMGVGAMTGEAESAST